MRSDPIEKITLTQFFLIIVIFQLGTSIVVGVGNTAKQDAWISVSLATIYGVLLFGGYCYLVSFAPERTLYSLLREAYGNVLSRVIAYLYVLYFLYIGTRVARDFCELLTTSIYPRTPIEIIALSLLLVCTYFIYHGIEVISRSAEIFFPYSATFLISLVLFLFVNGSVHVDNLRPVLEHGWGPVIHTLYPSLMGFPFGEVIAFTPLLVSVSRFDYVTKVGMAAVAASGIILMLFTLIILGVLGVDMLERVEFPLLSAIREISIAGFIERLDALVVFVMMLGIWLKVCVFLLAALKGMEYITSISYRRFVLPIGMLVAFMAVFISANFAEHIEEGLVFVPMYLHLPFQVGIPLITAVVFLVKARKRKGAKKHEEHEDVAQTEK